MDWSGRKPLDYRKQSTSISASTYSSKYTKDKYIPLEVLSSECSDKNVDDFKTIKPKRNKRFLPMNGIVRSHSLKDSMKQSSPIDTQNLQKRSMYFSPELDHGKRDHKLYRSILFRRKVAHTTNPNLDT